MFKLIKYELQGIYKEILGALILMLVLSLLLYTRIGIWKDGSIGGLVAVIIMVAMVWAFISSIKIFSKYMYDDTGYLMFTLPKTGYSILGSRIIVALIELWATIGMSLLIVKVILNKVITDQIIKEQMKNALSNVKTSDMFTIFISITFSWISIMMLIYFCIILSKIVINRKKIGKFGSFVTFIIFTVALGNFTPWLEKTFPKTINLLSITKSGGVLANFNGASTNVANMIFEISLTIVFFLSTAYFIDKKLEL